MSLSPMLEGLAPKVLLAGPPGANMLEQAEDDLGRVVLYAGLANPLEKPGVRDPA